MEKKNRRWISALLAVVLVAGALTAGLTAGANGGTMDLDGDGKVTIHDVQLAKEADEGIRTLSAKQLSARAVYSLTEIMNKLFGITHTISPNASGVYELDSVKDLLFFRDNSTKGYSFKLTGNIDLAGVEWISVDQFKGTFDGNGKTISNVTIKTGKKASNPASKDMQNMGFFAEVMADSVVKNLNLSNIEMELIDEYVQFAGLLVGTNRGTVENCFTYGKITDRRETVTISSPTNDGTDILLGALIGRCIGDGSYSTATGHYADEPTAPGTSSKYLSANITDHDPDKIPVAAQVALDVVPRTNTKVALCGWGKVTADPQTGPSQFQDISSTYGVSAAMRIKQDKVVDYMYKEGTVEWETLTEMTVIYSAHDENDSSVQPDKTIKAKVKQVGLPFTSYHNSLERFEYVLGKDTDGDGLLEVDSTLANVSDPNWYTSTYTTLDENADDNGSNGWIRYLGNDCSSSISWAWQQISPVNAYTTKTISGYKTQTGVFADSCRHIFPYEDAAETSWNDNYGHAHGIVKIGDYDFYQTDANGNVIKKFIAANVAEKTDMDGDGVVNANLDGRYATTSANLWDWNADNTKKADNEKYAKLYNTYAQARKGDAIHCWFTGNKPDGSRMWEGHIRLLAEDPVIIRDRDGYVDIDSSYLITHGHGGGIEARKSNASNTWNHNNGWALYQKYYLTDLDYEVGDCAASNGNNSSRCYLPITCRALRTETDTSALTEAIQWDIKNATAPYQGYIQTTYALSEVTVEVFADEAGESCVYTDTACALPEGGVNSVQYAVRFTPQNLREVRLDWLFPDMQSALAAKQLTSNGTYYFRVTICPVNDQYVNGSWVENTTYESHIKAFTYTAP